MSLYQDHILDHYHNPRNYGNLPHATHHAEALNPTCGDSLALDLNIEDGIIKEVGFTGKGCAISLASASLLFEEAKGKETVKMQGLALSPVRMKCALLSLETLKKALKSK